MALAGVGCRRWVPSTTISSSTRAVPSQPRVAKRLSISYRLGSSQSCLTRTKSDGVPCMSSSAMRPRPAFGRRTDVAGRSSLQGCTNLPRRQVAAGAVPDPWGVSQDAWESIEANLFAASLFPYLAFLWLLDRPETECPPRVSFSFKFLLVFVFATIPAGIYAKTHYGTVLANVDWLHGTAESLLTVTNLLLVISLRDAINNATGGKGTDSDLGSVKGALLGLALAVTLLGSTAAPLSADALLAAAPEAAATAATAATEQLSLSSGLLPLHDEPSNALSIPTWAVHTSSVIEYLVAMGLVWNYAEATDNPRWKGLTWGMLPLHSSGITACVYHLFYNSPSLNALVALQASLTVIGNTTCAAATFRIWREGVDRLESSGEAPRANASSSAQKRGVEDDELLAPGWEDLGEAYKDDTNLVFALKLAAWSLVLGVAIKYGELALDLPFSEHPLIPSLAVIGIPSLFNVAKWARLSAKDGDGAAATTDP